MKSFKLGILMQKHRGMPAMGRVGHMLWHIFGLFVLMSHSFLAPVGVMEDHDSLCGYQAVGCLFVKEMFFIVMCFVCLSL